MIDQTLLRAKIKEITGHPLVKHFLSNPRYERLFNHVLEHPDSEEAECLDREFKRFYKNIRMIKYRRQSDFARAAPRGPVRRCLGTGRGF